jgi:hypothetical protein
MTVCPYTKDPRLKIDEIMIHYYTLQVPFLIPILRPVLTALALVLIIFKITRTRILRTQDLWFRVVFIRAWVLRIQVLVILKITKTRTGAVRNGLKISILRTLNSPVEGAGYSTPVSGFTIHPYLGLLNKGNSGFIIHPYPGLLYTRVRVY